MLPDRQILMGITIEIRMLAEAMIILFAVIAMTNVSIQSVNKVTISSMRNIAKNLTIAGQQAWNI